MVLKNGKIYVQPEQGIVYDSIPKSEHQESLNKARGCSRLCALLLAALKLQNGN